jgi:hypothetical protein
MAQCRLDPLFQQSEKSQFVSWTGLFGEFAQGKFEWGLQRIQTESHLGVTNGLEH